MAHPSSKVLVVEDDPDTREILVELFEAHGYEVTAVATAEAGLEALEGRTTDLVFSDNHLDGGRTGAWMLERAFRRGLLDAVGAVMYTADEEPDVPRVVRVLRKPTPLRILEATAERAIDSARMRPRRSRVSGELDIDVVPSSRSAGRA